jgi:hypothetical protein
VCAQQRICMAVHGHVASCGSAPPACIAASRRSVGRGRLVPALPCWRSRSGAALCRMRAHAFLAWVICGRRQLRVHNRMVAWKAHAAAFGGTLLHLAARCCIWRHAAACLWHA